MSRVLVALFGLASVLAGVLWYVASSRPQRTPAAARAMPERSAAQPAVASTELVAAPEPAPAADVTPAEPARREAALTTPEDELTRAHWVAGRVLFPAGTPADEELYVTADGRDFEDGSDHRVKVERDGSFRVAFSAESRSGRLELDGRYLYLRESVRWKRDASEAPVLEPLLGGRIAVRTRLAAGTDAAQAGGKIELRFEERPGHRTWQNERGSAALSAEQTAAFDALTPGSGYEVFYDGPTLVGASASVRVEAGATAAVELELFPGVVLAGSVRDESGAPLVAEVRAYSEGTGNAFGPDRYRSMTTGADGAFRLGALAPGEIGLMAERDGYTSAVLELEKIEAGATRADLALVLTRGAAIAGLVLWPDGTPAEASVQLSPRYDSGTWQAGLREANGRSDASGRFRITGLAAESYRIEARATKTEEITVTSELSGRERRKKQRTQWSAELEPVAAGSEDLVLTLSGGLTLAGRVLDEQGVPLADFHVAAVRVIERGIFQFDASKYFRDADGSFLLVGLFPGEWEVSASAGSAGYAPSPRLRVTIPAEEPIEFRLARMASMSGIVLDAAGAPSSNATIEVDQHGQDEGTNFQAHASGRTDASGAFRLEGLRPGATVLTARRPDCAPSVPVELELAAGEQHDGLVLRLRRGATLAVEVVARDGSPEAGVEVSLFGLGGNYHGSFTTDASGRFEARELPPGSFSLHVQSFEGLALTGRAKLAEGESGRVRLAPPADAPVRLHGRLSAGGEPLVEAGVFARPLDEGRESTSSSARSNAQGAYELTLPGAGRYELILHRGSHDSLSWRTQLDVPAGPEFAFDVSIPVGRVSGRVTDRSGKALAEVPIEAEPERHGGGAHGGARTRTDGEGRYELVLPVGTHTLEAGGADRYGSSDSSAAFVAERAQGLVVAENSTLRGVDFVLSAGGSIAGRVRIADGSAFLHARVWSSDAGGMRELGVTGSDGTFEFGGLTPGTHWIRATSGSLATTAPTRVEVEAGETTRLELELEPATRVSVRVRDAAGAPVGCELEALDREGRRLPQHSLSEPGAYLVGPLAPERYTLRARREGKTAERVVEVAAGGEELEVELAFE